MKAGVLMHKKRNKTFIILFCVFLSVLILVSAFLYTDKNLRLIILEMSESKIGTLMSDCANTAVNRAVKENNIQYDDIVRVTRDANNNVTSIQTDVIKLNEIRTEIDYLFSEEMNRRPEIHLSVPIGTIIGNEYTVGRGPKINFRLDLSVLNHLDYYNGILIQGYVKNSPAPVLSGGRYDSLAKKIRGDGGAFGFAVYLDGLNLHYPTPKDFDCDAIIIYKQSDAKLLTAVNDMFQKGMTVRVERKMPEGIKAKKIFEYKNGNLTEVAE